MTKTLIVTFQSDLTQKCYLSSTLFPALCAEIGDCVAINCNKLNKTLLCLLYPHRQQNALLNYVLADDSVSCGDDSSSTYVEASFPQDFKLFRSIQLKKIEVRVVLENIEALSRTRDTPEKMRNTVSIALQQNLVLPTFRFNCFKHKVAGAYGICRIDILDIFENVNFVGKVVTSTEIEISSIIASRDHLEQLHRFVDLKLGGVNHLLSSAVNFLQKSTDRTPIILTGPSGCGKSMFVKKVAILTESYLVIICVTDLLRKNASALSMLYRKIAQLCHLPSNIPCIIFFDNLDHRFSSNSKDRKVLHLVLSFMDMASKLSNVKVFGAAVTLKFIHPLLTTSKRFTKEIRIGVPTMEQRIEILTVLTCDKNSTADTSEIAKKTHGYVASDLSLLCMEAESIASELSDSRPISNEDFLAALKVVKPSILKDSNYKMDVQPVYWSHIGGMEAIKRRVKMCIEWPLLHQRVYSKVGLPHVRGILLFGPPGCCKTTIVRVLATECKVSFLSASPAQIFGPFFGDSEKSIFELFRQARLCAPSIVFLDEIDSIVGKRSYSNKHRGIQEKVLSCLLTEMDGFGVHSESLQGSDKISGNERNGLEGANVIVVGATNRIDLIDDALLRPGRFDSMLYVPPPNTEERESILKKLTEKMLPEGSDLKWLAERTQLFSGADLQNLCRMAALRAIKGTSKVTKEHFSAVLNLVSPSITKEQLDNYEKLAKMSSL